MCCTLRAASAAALFCAVSAASADVIDFQSLSVSARQAFAPFADTDMATDFGSLTGSSPSAVGVNASSSQPFPFSNAAIGAAIQPLSETLTGSSILQSYDYDVNTQLDRFGPVAAGALVLTSSSDWSLDYVVGDSLFAGNLGYFEVYSGDVVAASSFGDVTIASGATRLARVEATTNSQMIGSLDFSQGTFTIFTFVTNSQFSSAGGNNSFGFRIATTVPIPAPTAAMSGVLGLALLGCRRRR